MVVLIGQYCGTPVLHFLDGHIVFHKVGDCADELHITRLIGSFAVYAVERRVGFYTTVTSDVCHLSSAESTQTFLFEPEVHNVGRVNRKHVLLITSTDASELNQVGPRVFGVEPVGVSLYARAVETLAVGLAFSFARRRAALSELAQRPLRLTTFTVTHV